MDNKENQGAIRPAVWLVCAFVALIAISLIGLGKKESSKALPKSEVPVAKIEVEKKAAEKKSAETTGKKNGSVQLIVDLDLKTLATVPSPSVKTK
jgi:hypothetical protein